MDFLTLLLLFFLALLALIFRKWPPRSSLGPLPPGPKGFPLIGSLLSMNRHEFLTFVEWRKKYGDVYSFQNGTQLMVMLSSYDALKEAFHRNEAFNGRPNGKYIRSIVKHSGIVLNDGPVWQEHRRFILRVLRDFGFGRTLSEDIISAEWQSLKSHVGRPVELRPIFVSCINNVITSLALGERTAAEDPQFSELTRRLEVVFNGFTFATLLPVLFPFIMHVKPLLSFIESFMPFKAAMDFSHDFIRRKIEEHRQHLLQSGDIANMDQSQARDVCDALLIERARLERNGETHSFTDWQVVRDLLELFLAGTDTTATTLAWTAFFMASNLEVQKKVHEEIDSVIGNSRQAVMKDRLEMPYVCAVMDEVLRRSSLARSGIPHRAMYDTKLFGYVIPKDTAILSNLYGIHHDPAHWEKPQEFYPEHFLDSDGRYKPSEFLNPFSLGKRVCLGETLARMEIFLFTVNIMQNFSIEMADPKADIEKIALGTTGNLRRALPHEVVLTKRM